MLVRIQLRYAREPELVAIRFNPAYKFQGLAKQALRAFIEQRPFEIVIPDKTMYEKRSLKCDLSLDDVKDADIIAFLQSLKAPKSTFIRNLMLRYITGDISYAYTDEELKEMSVTEKCRQLRVTMAQSDKNATDVKVQTHNEMSELEAALQALQERNI